MKNYLTLISSILLTTVFIQGIEVVQVDVKRKPYDEKWTNRETRILEAGKRSGTACCDSLDQYGGKKSPGFNKTGFFHVEKEGDAWVLVDPEGNPFISRGINSVRMGTTEGSLNVFKQK